MKFKVGDIVKVKSVRVNRTFKVAQCYDNSPFECTLDVLEIGEGHFFTSQKESIFEIEPGLLKKGHYLTKIFQN